MALIDPKHYERLDIPDEPGEWVEMRPRMIGDLVGVDQGPGSGFVALSKQIRAWSYDEPVSTESISRLDLATYNFLTAYRQRSADEKKGSDSPSSQPTEPVTANGPESSVT